MHQYKTQNIPDKSYDIDGDGEVGPSDYLFAKMFDTGNKGHLTDQEITDCRTKLRDPKFSDKFLFGLEA